MTASPPTRSVEDVDALGAAVTAAVRDVVPGTEVGLAVHDRVTGSGVADVNADRQFYTASVVKLLIAIHALRGAGWDLPTGAERDDLAAMLSRSDDGIASRLWGGRGGTEIVRETATLIDLERTSPPRDPGRWELTRMSARDVLRVYEFVCEDMPKRASEFVVDALAGAAPRGADGFYQHFGIADALPDAQRAIKQGWMRVDAGLVLNTTGLVGSDDRYIAVLLTQQPTTADFDTGRAAVTAGMVALAPVLSPDT